MPAPLSSTRGVGEEQQKHDNARGIDSDEGVGLVRHENAQDGGGFGANAPTFQHVPLVRNESDYNYSSSSRSSSPDADSQAGAAKPAAAAKPVAGESIRQPSPSLLAKKPSPLAKRNVSWGNDTKGGEDNVSPMSISRSPGMVPKPEPPPFAQSSIRSPLIKESKGMTILEMLKRGNMLDGQDVSRRAMELQQPLSLNDLKDPLELQAETGIFRSLDEKKEEDDAASSILEFVPDDTVHGFSIQPSFSNDSDAKDQSNKSHRSGGSKDGRSLRRPSVFSQGSRAVSSSKSPKSMWSTARQKQKDGAITAEQNIFGLASALQAMQQQEVRDHSVSRAHSFGSPKVGDATGATDRLGATVDILFARPRADTLGSHSRKSMSGDVPQDSAAVTETPELQPASKWKIVRDNAPTLAQMPDLEIGLNDEHQKGEASKSAASSANRSSRETSGDSIESSDTGSKVDSQNSNRRSSRNYIFTNAVAKEWTHMKDFLKPRTSSFATYLKWVILYLMFPLLSIAALLFYAFDNPPYGREPHDLKKASVSWWLVFAVRQLVTFTLAMATEIFVIDYLALQTKVTLNLFGALPTLLIIQSKGWPFIVFSWGVWDFGVLAGDSEFVRHWLWWQDSIGLFNVQNPGGEVAKGSLYFRLLSVAVSVGAAVAVKRLVLGLYLGRKTFANYSESLELVMEKMLVISEVAALARGFDKSIPRHTSRQSNEATPSAISAENLDTLLNYVDSKAADSKAQDEGDGFNGDDDDGVSSIGDDVSRIIDSNDHVMSSTQKARVAELLGSWEEPPRGKYARMSNVPISAVFQFRRALKTMETDYPFSPAFGIADTRESCVASAQEVYLRLLSHTPDSDGILPFGTIATIALQKNGELDLDRVKKLIHVFRPDKDASLSLIDFVRSVDDVYKDLKMLRAGVLNASKIDSALEDLINIPFYGAILIILLHRFGYDPLSVFLSLSSLILVFAFVFNRASASYFEGILFIVVQRPFDIGHRINVSNPESEANSSGAQGWIVEDITLFYTTVYLVATNERATISNGALAKSRIINDGRSERAVMYFTLKFAMDVSFDKVMVIRDAVDDFVKARPREWISLLGFRANRIEANLGFIEYVVVLQHRESWQKIGVVLQSKAIVQNFCLELQQRMNIRYLSPPRPVNLTFTNGPRKGERKAGGATSDMSTIATGKFDQMCAASAAVFDGE